MAGWLTRVAAHSISEKAGRWCRWSALAEKVLHLQLPFCYVHADFGGYASLEVREILELLRMVRPQYDIIYVSGDTDSLRARAPLAHSPCSSS